MTRKVGAVVLFILGYAVGASPAVLGLGWVAILVGIILGTCIGVMSGLVWVMRPKRYDAYLPAKAATQEEAPAADVGA